MCLSLCLYFAMVVENKHLRLLFFLLPFYFHMYLFPCVNVCVCRLGKAISHILGQAWKAEAQMMSLSQVLSLQTRGQALNIGALLRDK